MRPPRHPRPIYRRRSDAFTRPLRRRVGRRPAVDRSDLSAVLSLVVYAVLAAVLLIVGAYTAGVAAGLAVQGFELVR